MQSLYPSTDGIDRNYVIMHAVANVRRASTHPYDMPVRAHQTIRFHCKLIFQCTDDPFSESPAYDGNV